MPPKASKKAKAPPPPPGPPPAPVPLQEACVADGMAGVLGVARLEGELRVAEATAAMVEWRVSECRRAGELELDLTASDLEDVPGEELATLPWLRVLSLDRNRLTHESTWGALSARALPALKALCVRGNALLGPLPEALGAIAGGLEELALDDNMITALPLSAAALRDLQWLSLCNNQIGPEIPGPVLGAWTKLTHLDVRCNKLTSLPPELGECTALQELLLGDNLLASLPESIGHCTQLRVLAAGRNALVELPTGLAACTALEVLDVSHNKLTVLPGEVLEPLAQLRQLLASCNQLGFLPDQIGTLANLEVLALSGNQLKALPDSWTGLASLRELYCQNNAGITALPACAITWKALATAQFKGCKLKALPPGVEEAWAQLEVLDAQGKKPTLKVPEDIKAKLPRAARLLGATFVKAKAKKAGKAKK